VDQLLSVPIGVGPARLTIGVVADGLAALQKRIGDETMMWRGVIDKAGIKMD
jgi:hypothetical protein